MIRNNKLSIFESFVVDTTLPKYTEAQEVNLTGSIQGINGLAISSSSTGTFGSISVPTFGFQSNDSVPFNPKTGWWSKFIEKFKKKKIEQKKTMTIISFFASLGQSLNDLKTVSDIAVHYETAITNAAKAGQVALVDQLKARLASAKSEVQLLTLGLNKYLVEDQIVDFYKKADSDQNLKLTWIRHFVKPIPGKLLDLKFKLDQQFVFDNYVILHYDPNNDATDNTQEEKEQIKKRKEDPILFGVINGSRRLYYIGDWIDTYCDLTLDTVLETLRERVIEINNDTVKTYLDRGVRKDEREKLPEPETTPPNYSATTSTFSYLKGTTKKVLKKVKNLPKDVMRLRISDMSQSKFSNKKKK